MRELWILPAAALLGYFGAWGALIYARRFRLYDPPGERRSHVTPTPRGGGVGIALAMLGATAWLGYSGGLAFNWGLGVFGGILIVSATGWWEDHRSLAPWVRIGAHAVAGAWLILWGGGAEQMQLGPFTLPLGPLSELLPFLGVLWLINLFNFMDGIDTLAAGESLFAGAVLGGWFAMAGEPAAAILAFAVAAACAGFLPWNRPPARIFMGDVGSTSLGFVFAALVIHGEHSNTLSALAGMVILGVFVFDATFTVISRWLRGMQWYTAHREHAYQYLVRAGLSHGRAALQLMAVNVVLVLPAAVVMFVWPGTQAVVALVCVAAAGLLWWSVRAASAAKENFL